MPFSGFGDLNGDFSSRLQQLIAASGGRISITSGYRSPERQQQLWQAALAKYGDPEIADNWVARPGKSNHGRGIAADLGFADAGARQWAHANAARYGLHFPMEWEPWHVEPTGVAGQSDPGAYTTPPTGFENPAVAMEDPNDPEVQFERLMGAMFGEGPQAPESGAQEVVAGPEGLAAPAEIEEQLTLAAGAGANGPAGGAVDGDQL